MSNTSGTCKKKMQVKSKKKEIELLTKMRKLDIFFVKTTTANALKNDPEEASCTASNTPTSSDDNAIVSIKVISTAGPEREVSRITNELTAPLTSSPLTVVRNIHHYE